MEKLGSPKIFRLRIAIIFGFLVVAALMASMFFTYTNSQEKAINNPEAIYKTWKVVKFYKNGRLVLNDQKYQDLKFRVNKNGTAEWVRPDGSTLLLSFRITEDGSQIIFDDGFSVEDIETIFELHEKKFRFGKRNIASQYEYVLVPIESAISSD
ncbi:MAG TPA: hypothetical protein VIK89_02965 [Cytophagaceae bacterium]